LHQSLDWSSPLPADAGANGRGRSLFTSIYLPLLHHAAYIPLRSVSMLLLHGAILGELFATGAIMLCRVRDTTSRHIRLNRYESHWLVSTSARGVDGISVH